MYKAHIYRKVGEGKFLRNTAACGRKSFHNNKGSMIVGMKYFKQQYDNDVDNVCSRCLARATEQGRTSWLNKN